MQDSKNIDYAKQHHTPHCWLPAKVMYLANSTKRFSWLTRSVSILLMKNVQIYIHEEALCCKSLKIVYVMEVVASLIRARGLNHHQFDNLLNDEGSHGLLFHGEVRCLSLGIVLKRLFELQWKILNFM